MVVGHRHRNLPNFLIRILWIINVGIVSIHRTLIRAISIHFRFGSIFPSIVLFVHVAHVIQLLCFVVSFAFFEQFCRLIRSVHFNRRTIQRQGLCAVTVHVLPLVIPGKRETFISVWIEKIRSGIQCLLWIGWTLSQCVARRRSKCWIRNRLLDSIVVGDFEGLRKKVNAQRDVDQPNCESTETYDHHDCGRRFPRHYQIFRLIRLLRIVHGNTMCFVLRKGVNAKELDCSTMSER